MQEEVILLHNDLPLYLVILIYLETNLLNCLERNCSFFSGKSFPGTSTHGRVPSAAMKLLIASCDTSLIVIVTI